MSSFLNIFFCVIETDDFESAILPAQQKSSKK